MKIDRIWAMPNRWTFSIKPIKELLKRYNVGDGWIDPFAGKYSFAEITNDINIQMPAIYHLEAIEFLNLFKIKKIEFDGGLYDPPYSLRQIIECYKGFGKDNIDKRWATTKFYSDTKTALADLIKINGICISFGWNSIGLGKKRGFEIIEILLISHGRLHNDTIITVEKKTDRIKNWDT
jgi:hypothetical protein